MKTITLTYVKDTKNCHHYTPEAGQGGACGQLYFPKGYFETAVAPPRVVICVTALAD
jgi:hypothetical protein